jgi:hypothetical protein
VSLTLPGEPQVNASPDTGVTPASVYSWTGSGAGVYTAEFSSGTSSAPVFVVVTSATSAHVPDLSAYGLALPTQTNYAFTVSESFDFATVDDALGPTGYRTMAAAVLGPPGAAATTGPVERGPSTGGSFAAAAPRAFTTQ